MKISRATLKDCQDVWNWRNDVETRLMFWSSDYINWESHVEWYELALKKTDQILLIGRDYNNEKVGIVRFTLLNDSKAEVSININPKKRGLNLSKPLLVKALEYADSLGIKEFIAEIKNKNSLSHSLFKGLGFELIKRKKTFSLFNLKI